MCTQLDSLLQGLYFKHFSLDVWFGIGQTQWNTESQNACLSSAMPRHVSKMVSYCNNAFCCYSSYHTSIVYELSFGHYHKNLLYWLISFWGKPPLFLTSFKNIPARFPVNQSVLRTAPFSKRLSVFPRCHVGSCRPWSRRSHPRLSLTLVAVLQRIKQPCAPYRLGRKVTWELF